MSDQDPDTERTRPANRLLFAGIAVLLIAVVLGAVQLWFLCDDAFITFRYVANARDGFGLVWNPEPFAPVEGYTGFLWALLLWATWSCLGVEPPQAANVLSIVCGALLFVVTSAVALRIRDRGGRQLSAASVLLGLLLVAGNRSFLTWMTGGLETALFNLAFVTWVVLAFRSRERRSTAWLAAWATTAALATLTRPDGLLLVAASVAAAGFCIWQRERTWRATALSLSPLLLVVAQLAFRLAYYGEWLPNTYYAKVTSPWPEAGARFLACFLFEHGAWLWPPIASVWLIGELTRGAGAALRSLWQRLPALLATGTVFAHVGYYVVRVGGDPFEYRILSQLVPLGALAVLAMAARLGRGSLLPIVCTAAVGIASTAGWLHMAYHEPTLSPFYRPIADRLPSVLQPVFRWHDRNQAWLKVQVLCGRRGAHAMFLDSLRQSLPARERRAVDASDLPVAQFTGVGLPGWVLPDCMILDLLGLNDWVVARTPVTERSHSLLPKAMLDALLLTADDDHDGIYTRAELRQALLAVPGATATQVDELAGFFVLMFGDTSTDALTAADAVRIEPFFTDMRFMAHSRVAPKDYVDALMPNVTIEARRVVVRPRAVPLSAERVRAVETEWRQRTRERSGG